jgi:polyphosphate kinase
MTRPREHTLIDRELSWLSFNGRVLQEAADPTVPLGERLNFLGIFSSNLDEFFRVRVASLRSLLRLKKKRVEELGFSPADVLRDIHQVVSAQQNRFGEIFRNEILPALEKSGIRLLTERELSPDQAATADAWFDDQVAPLLQVEVLGAGTPAPFLRNREVYLVVELWPGEGRSVAGDEPRYALINVPSPPLPRFLALDDEGGRHAVVFLDDVIRRNLHKAFPSNDVGGAWAIKMSRDAELYLEDEFSGDLVQTIRKSLKKRETGMPSRFLYDLQAPWSLIRELGARLDLASEDLVQGARYHNLHDLSDFPRFDRPDLTWPELPPLPHPDLEDAPSLIDAIAERDHLLHFPYQRFDYAIRLMEEAAHDPDVEEIWITLYRVARDSVIAEALIHAAEAGKRVHAFIEVKARFDEATNLAIAERLERAGVHTHYSMPGLKVHCKLALIARREAGGTRLHAWLGTGNFNERTARIYSDSALLTADPAMTSDVRHVFAFLCGESREPSFEHLLVAPFHLRKRFNRLVDAEIDAAKAGKPAGMILKMNSLEDERMIERLYSASAAGVPIDLIVRGICRLVAGEPGLSETIRARSIVGRFLEHSRVYIFENRGDPLCYLASADWMTRNLSRRVEVTFPLLDPDLQQEMRSILDIQLSDNRKARILDAAQTNEYVREPGARPIDAQLETYRFLRAKLAPNPTAGTAKGAFPHDNPVPA